MATNRIYNVTYLGFVGDFGSTRELEALVQAKSLADAAKKIRGAVKRNYTDVTFHRAIKIEEKGELI